MNYLKSLFKQYLNFTVVLILLIIIFVFEFFASKNLIPSYTSLQQYRILLIASGIISLLLLIIVKKKALLIQILFILIFSISRTDEVLFILPKFYDPNLFLSIFIFTNFLAIYILVFYTNFNFSKFIPISFFIFSVAFEFLYFKKLKDLPPIIQILIIATTVSVAIISKLLKMEQNKRKVIRKMYNKEVALKNKIALMKGRMMEQEKAFSLSMLTAGIAHELGNPINYLQGNHFFIKKYIEDLIKMIEIKSLNNKQKESLLKIKDDYKSIVEHSQKGFDTITEIIANMKHIYGNRQNRKDKTNIKDLLVRTIDFFTASHSVDNYSIETDLNPNFTVCLNPGEYYIVFSNILTNALESIDFKKKLGSVKIITAKQDEFIQVIISDNGSGIKKEDFNRVFDPFFSTKKVKHNLGLGLALCREIVLSDNGNITVTSKKGEGTTVTVFIKEYRENE